MALGSGRASGSGTSVAAANTRTTRNCRCSETTMTGTRVGALATTGVFFALIRVVTHSEVDTDAKIERRVC